MRFELRYSLSSAVLLAAAALIGPSVIWAQSPPPGAIFDLATSPQLSTATGGTGILSSTTYSTFTTSFVGDGNVEFVSFAFREVPAFWGFDDASVMASGSSVNLLSDPGFEAATYGQNCNHGNSLGCPSGWGAWIQPVDTSFIGQVATSSNPYDCAGPRSGSGFWCDGSVEGYDAVYQGISTTAGMTYNVGFSLTDNSGENIATAGEGIDMLAYAGDNIPVGSVSIGPPPPPISTPEPSSLLLLGVGLAGLFLLSPKQRMRRLV